MASQANTHFTEKQILNAHTGVCGIDIIASGETYTGSWIKVVGITPKFVADGVLYNFTSSVANSVTTFDIYANTMYNSGSAAIYCYKTSQNLSHKA